jgi:hypothetical protein
MIDFVHAHQPRRELKHVVAQRDDDELGVLGALLDVVGNDRDLRTMLVRVRIQRMKGSTWNAHASVNTGGRIAAECLRVRVVLTFLKSNAASISSMTYRGVGL